MKESVKRLMSFVAANRLAFIVSAAAFVVSFILIGIPGALFYIPASFIMWFLGMGGNELDKLNGDNIWPILILTSFLASLLVVPAHVLVKHKFGLNSRWKHVVSVSASIWVVTVIASMALTYSFLV